MERVKEHDELHCVFCGTRIEDDDEIVGTRDTGCAHLECSRIDAEATRNSFMSAYEAIESAHGNGFADMWAEALEDFIQDQHELDVYDSVIDDLYDTYLDGLAHEPDNCPTCGKNDVHENLMECMSCYFMGIDYEMEMPY